MISYAKVAAKLCGKSIGASYSTQEEADAHMMWAYQFANPNGRPYHDDWKAKFLPDAIQPWSKIRRMDTTFEIPLPFRMIEGNMKQRWMPWQEGYPEAPGIQLRAAVDGSEAQGRGIPREVYAFDPVGGPGEWGRFEGYLFDEWVECYYSSTIKLFGKRLHTNRIAKPDMTWGDFHVAWPDASLTWTKL